MLLLLLLCRSILFGIRSDTARHAPFIGSVLLLHRRRTTIIRLISHVLLLFLLLLPQDLLELLVTSTPTIARHHHHPCRRITARHATERCSSRRCQTGPASRTTIHETLNGVCFFFGRPLRIRHNFLYAMSSARFGFGTTTTGGSDGCRGGQAPAASERWWVRRCEIKVHGCCCRECRDGASLGVLVPVRLEHWRF